MGTKLTGKITLVTRGGSELGFDREAIHRRRSARDRGTQTRIGDGYTAALINYGYVAGAILTTDDAVTAMQ
jgi:hypothetical protein